MLPSHAPTIGTKGLKFRTGINHSKIHACVELFGLQDRGPDRRLRLGRGYLCQGVASAPICALSCTFVLAPFSRLRDLPLAEVPATVGPLEAAHIPESSDTDSD
jgi:hypothetical protein